MHLAPQERLVTVLRESPAPVFLLGAGASVSSGVPLAKAIVEKAGKWAYAKAHGHHPDDYRIQRSDWYRWLAGHSWFVEGDLGSNYPHVVEHLLQPRMQRAEFFRERVLDTGVPPGRGYLGLAELLDRGAVHTVLTTNFDRLVLQAARQVGRPHHIETVQVQSDAARFSTAGGYPQLIFLHGSVEHYTDQNMLEEVQRLRPWLVDLVFPLLRDHPLVVIGYRGAEPSVMEHLLVENVDRAGGYRHGIYWCTRDGGSADDFDEDELHPLVRDLARVIGGNFHAVPIEGFDELVAGTLWPRYQAEPSLAWTNPRPTREGPAPTSDMQPVEGIGAESLDLVLARARLVQYCEALDIRVPEKPDDGWVLDQMADRNLVRERGAGVVPTVAGYVLFGRDPQSAVASAETRIRFTGSRDWMERMLGDEAGQGGNGEADEGTDVTVERLVGGTLWNQLDRVTDALALVNRPFRLKGAVSEPAFPYPSLLLKELIVNALVHRDFDAEEPVTIEVSPSLIRLSNPGGLVEEVRQQVESESIEEEIRSGHRGIKGYRNPVITDLFYGAGNMDKSGSGLYDVLRLAADNGNEVRFGPTDENARFEATVYARPEAVDEVTGTASPVDIKTTRFSANTVEVVDLPETVWHAASPHRGGGAVYAATGADWLPAFLTWSGRLFTFSDLDASRNPLRGAVTSEAEPLALDEFTGLMGEQESSGSESNNGEATISLTGSKTGEDLLTWLLGLYLHRHLEARGLIVDKKRRRAYFPRSAAGPRPITYQARLRRATRTVVKPRGSRKDGSPSFWEHASLSYRFEKFGDTWVLMLVPGYVFTFDGRRRLLQSERVNKLSTRRASRDYNSNVHHNLVFWLWVLSGGASGTFPLYDGPSLDPLDTSFAPGDDPDAFFNSADPEDSAPAPDDGEFDDEGYTVLGVSADEVAPYIGSVRLRAELPTAAVHEVVVADGEEGDSDYDDDEFVELIAEEAERERDAQAGLSEEEPSR